MLLTIKHTHSNHKQMHKPKVKHNSLAAVMIQWTVTWWPLISIGWMRWMQESRLSSRKHIKCTDRIWNTASQAGRKLHLNTSRVVQQDRLRMSSLMRTPSATLMHSGGIQHETCYGYHYHHDCNWRGRGRTIQSSSEISSVSYDGIFLSWGEAVSSRMDVLSIQTILNIYYQP